MGMIEASRPPWRDEYLSLGGGPSNQQFRKMPFGGER
jgi:hypothetical protein